jgi:hypothetical protein
MLRLSQAYIAGIPSPEYTFPTEHVMQTKTCHYYAAGQCRRGPACHFKHSPPESAPQGKVSLVSASSPRAYIQGIPPSEYVYPNGHVVHTRAPYKECDQDIGHSHSYTAHAVYTVAPHVVPYGFDGRDNSSNISSSDSTPSDQSLNAAFQVMTIEEPVSSEYLPSTFSQLSPSLRYPNNTSTRCSNVAYNREYTPTGSKSRTATCRKAEQGKEKPTLYRSEFSRYPLLAIICCSSP